MYPPCPNQDHDLTRHCKNVVHRLQPFGLAQAAVLLITRRLLNFLLSNCTWEDGTVVATFRQPF
jgi:hypothetical protein